MRASPPRDTLPLADHEISRFPFKERPHIITVWLTLEQIQLVAILRLFGAGLLLRKNL